MTSWRTISCTCTNVNTTVVCYDKPGACIQEINHIRDNGSVTSTAVDKKVVCVGKIFQISCVDGKNFKAGFCTCHVCYGRSNPCLYTGIPLWPRAPPPAKVVWCEVGFRLT